MSKPRMIGKSFRFTHRGIESLPPAPKDGSSSCIEYSDMQERGLRLAVFKSGFKSFRHRYTFLGKKQVLTLGEFPAVCVEEARRRVRENKVLLSQDLNPKDERNHLREALTFEEFVMVHYVPFASRERRSWRDIENRIKLRLLPTFGDDQLPRITKNQIASFHQKLRDDISAATANRYLALTSAIFNKAIEWGHVNDNPARGISKYKESGPRSRVLSTDELTRFMTALNEILDQPSARAIFLLISLGLRRNEVLSSTWSNIDFTRKQLYLPITKAGTPRHVNLNSLALELLQQMHKERDVINPWVFPSKSKTGHLNEVRKTFDTINKKAGIKQLRLHDLRRSFASNLVNAGVSIYEVRDLLGHADVRTTQVYAHLETAALQQASETAAEELRKALAG